MKKISIVEVKQVRVGVWEHEIDVVRKVEDAYSVLRHFLEDADREWFVILMLNTKNRVLGIHTVSVGSINAAIVHPREVFKAAILCNASGIICCHNHPSGDSSPSPEDVSISKRLAEAGELLGIEVMDSFIIGQSGYFSLREQGMM